MPNKVSWEQGNLRFETCNNTDFWQDTWYGFRRDSGHFLGLQAPSDFSSTISFEAQYKELYDQAGIMMRVNANNWIKAGIEFSDGVTNFSTVVTRDGKSDWSVIASPGLSGVQQVRLTRVRDSVLLHFLTKDQVWQLMRLTAFCTREAKVGPMACTPERSGLSVTVSKFTIAPPSTDPLHG
jgi:regulation of enolase protein 1 (concanavalin A-like superfamily)